MSGFTNGVRCGRNTLLIVWAGHTTRNQPECSWSGWGASAVEGITVRSEATVQWRVLWDCLRRSDRRLRTGGLLFSPGRGAADPQGFYLLLAGGNDRRDAARISTRTSEPRQRCEPSRTLRTPLETFTSRERGSLCWSTRAKSGSFLMVGDNFTAQEPTFRSSSTHGYNFTLITCTLCQDASCSILIYSAASRSCSRVWVAPCKDGPPDVCDQTLFFDSVHPNARVHKIIGKRLKTDCSREHRPRP